MSKHLQDDMKRLSRELLAMGSMVEEATNKSISALVNRRAELAWEVMEGDDAIDAKELEVEDACLKILALHQPVASDLRFIIAVMKVNNDLERMGDLAQNIAERASYLTTHDAIDATLAFDEMADAVRGMVTLALDALVDRDTTKARAVCERDDLVDEYNRNMFATLQALMKRDPDTVERAVHTLSVSRHLERIADLATNIAEDIVFMVDGEVMRHHSEPTPRVLPPIES